MAGVGPEDIDVAQVQDTDFTPGGTSTSGAEVMHMAEMDALFTSLQHRAFRGEL